MVINNWFVLAAGFMEVNRDGGDLTSRQSWNAGVW
jgi:hypothetical protein